MKGMLVVNAALCVGCHSCELACAVAHSASKELFQAILEEPRPSPRVTVAQGEGFAVPLQCRQCENAPCVAVCPTRALDRSDPDSPVILEHDLCIGCKWCVLVCPFGVIRMDEHAHAIIKCDLCIERLKQGQLPACVVACPTGALTFKTMDEVLDEKRKATLRELKCAMSGESK